MKIHAFNFKFIMLIQVHSSNMSLFHFLCTKILLSFCHIILFIFRPFDKFISLIQIHNNHISLFHSAYHSFSGFLTIDNESRLFDRSSKIGSASFSLFVKELFITEESLCNKVEVSMYSVKDVALRYNNSSNNFARFTRFFR